MGIVSFLSLALGPLLRLVKEKNLLLAGKESYFWLQGGGIYKGLFSWLNAFSPWVLYGLLIVAGLVSAFLFYNLLRRLKFEVEEAAVIVGLAALSPFFISFFNHPSAQMLIVPSMILAAWLILSWKKYLSYLGFALLLAVPLTGDIFNAIIAWVVLIIYYSHVREKRILLWLGGLICTTAVSLFYLGKPLLAGPVEISVNFWQGFVSEFGTAGGIGIFVLVLSCIGFVLTWKKAKNYTAVYGLLLFFLLTFIFFSQQSLIYLGLMLMVFAGRGATFLLKREWQMIPLRNLIWLVVGLGILFATLNYAVSFSVSSPDNSLIKALSWLHEESRTGEVVFSNYNNGLQIEFLAGRQAFIHQGMEKNVFESQREMMEKIFYSSEPQETLRLLKWSKIDYLLIDAQMREKLWKNKETGLLFVLANKQFERVYNKESVEIWYFERS